MNDPSRSRSFLSLFRDIADGSARLLRDELRLARIEITDVISSVASGSALVAIGGVLLLLGGLSLATGTVLLVGDQWLPRDRYWLGALVVVVIAGALGLWFARRGREALSPSRIAPETLETLKEDKAWLKQQLKSGATSS